jgi:hypothetical protein
MTPIEVTVINPSYWADKGLQLARLLGSGPAGPIPDPTGKAPDPERMLIISDPGYWSASLRELQEVLNLAAVDDGLSQPLAMEVDCRLELLAPAWRGSH